MPIVLAFQRQRQEDCDIKASLSIPARHFLSMTVIKVMVIMMVVVRRRRMELGMVADTYNSSPWENKAGRLSLSSTWST